MTEEECQERCKSAFISGMNFGRLGNSQDRIADAAKAYVAEVRRRGNLGATWQILNDACDEAARYYRE